jgi:hypothetical protein
MTGRVQTLRSSVAGNRPTGRQPGELYVNFADAQLGVVNASSAAQDLIGVTFFSTTSSYVVGQFAIQAGQLYRCVSATGPGAFAPTSWAQIGGSIVVGDTAPSNPQPGTLWWDSVGGQLYVLFNDGNSTQWVIAVNVAASLLPASTTVLGGVKVDGTSIQAAADGTISTVLIPMGDNRLINGDMRIDQRWNGAVETTQNTYTIDRWQYFGSQATKFSWGRNAGSAATPAGFPYYLGFVSASAYVVTSTDYFFLDQVIEADMVSDFAWGTPQAQPVTLSFWAFSSLTGTFSGCIANYANTRAYPFTYSIPVANTWTKIVLTIPGDTGGTWVLSGNSGAFGVMFDLGSGASRRGTAGAWATVASGINGATGTVSVVGTLNATFFVTGVKLEIGSVATPYNRQSLAKSLADCQRYYQSISQAGISIFAPAAGNGVMGSSLLLPVPMRAAPTVGFGSPAYANANTLAVNRVGPDEMRLTINILAAGVAYGIAAPLTLSAEL